MKILFIGDIFAGPGRDAVKELLPRTIQECGPDFVIANAENLTHGDGFSPKHIEEMQAAGIDFFTSGNHIWGVSQGLAKLDDDNFPVIRPANFKSDETPGKGYRVVDGVLVINLMGQVFMNKQYDCPFKAIDRILEEHKNVDLKAIFVDFHAETTSEKYAFAYYVDGRVSAVIGTHTHVPTADAHILESGTAYMTDAGMTGNRDSVIGVRKDLMIKRFLTQITVKHEPELIGQKVLNAVLIEVDAESKKALNINHVPKFL